MKLMSPSDFTDWFGADEVYVTSSGELDRLSTWTRYGVRPISYNKIDD